MSHTSMFSEEQLKQLLSLNESLRLQLEDTKAVLESREQEIELLQAVVNESNALRSKMENQQDEIEKYQYLLYKKDQQATGAVEREQELQLELTDLARLNITHNKLEQDHAYLNSRFSDVQDQLTALYERNFELQQVAQRVGELESRLEIALMENEALKNRIAMLEMQHQARDINL